MAQTTRAELLAQIHDYEHALIGIADKPHGYRELAEHFGQAPRNESVERRVRQMRPDRHRRA